MSQHENDPMEPDHGRQSDEEATDGEGHTRTEDDDEQQRVDVETDGVEAAEDGELEERPAEAEATTDDPHLARVESRQEPQGRSEHEETGDEPEEEEEETERQPADGAQEPAGEAVEVLGQSVDAAQQEAEPRRQPSGLAADEEREIAGGSGDAAEDEEPEARRPPSGDAQEEQEVHAEPADAAQDEEQQPRRPPSGDAQKESGGRAAATKPQSRRESPKEKAATKPPSRRESPKEKAAPVVDKLVISTPRKDDAPATVKFTLTPSGQVVTKAVPLYQTIKEMREQLAKELRMSSEHLLLMRDGARLGNDTLLSELGVGPTGSIQLQLASTDAASHPLKTYAVKPVMVTDVLTVKLDHGKNVVVEIDRVNSRKPFLGGFKHKQTGIEYHNAATQTATPVRVDSGVEKFSRDTQCHELQHKEAATTNEMATQMTDVGVFVSDASDKLVKPRKYVTAEQVYDTKLASAILLQRFWRRWLAKRRVNELRSQRNTREDWERREEQRRRKEKEERIRMDFERRLHPKNKEDFDLLHHALEKWRQEELAKINTTLTGAERKAALCELLDQEARLLASIGRHKLEADESTREAKIVNLLSKAASPKKWKAFDGNTTKMDTPFIIRARELRDIYQTLTMKHLSQDERLDILLTVKQTVQEHPCKLTKEVIELVDREADLLMRNIAEDNLAGLRKRIATLFLQYCKTPTFNPQIAPLLKVPQDPIDLKDNVHYCPGTQKYLKADEFPLSSDSLTMGRSRKFRETDNRARGRLELSHYKNMLQEVRRQEQHYDDGAQIAFLVQDDDLKYLVEKIWDCQSFISAWSDLYDLVMVRWEKREQWSPWNCILLTKDEAVAHEEIDDLMEGYGEVFITKVKRKHVFARSHFSKLPALASKMQKKA